jgi:adenylate cyclase
MSERGGDLVEGKLSVEGSQAFRNQTVLLVDDEDDVLDSLKDLFETVLDGVQVLTADSGQAGLDILDSQPIDLIVTDYKMPGMNGLEFLGQARGLAPGVPRILMTAFPDLGVAIHAINDAGIENFITKPFEPGQVIDVVRAILVERRAHLLRNQSFARSLDLLRRRLKVEP